MDRVGGYLSYLALAADANAYDDVVISMGGDYDASRVRDLEQRAKGKGR